MQQSFRYVYYGGRQEEGIEYNPQADRMRRRECRQRGSKGACVEVG